MKSWKCSQSRKSFKYLLRQNENNGELQRCWWLNSERLSLPISHGAIRLIIQALVTFRSSIILSQFKQLALVSLLNSITQSFHLGTGPIRKRWQYSFGIKSWILLVSRNLCANKIYQSSGRRKGSRLVICSILILATHYLLWAFKKLPDVSSSHDLVKGTWHVWFTNPLVLFTRGCSRRLCQDLRADRGSNMERISKTKVLGHK